MFRYLLVFLLIISGQSVHSQMLNGHPNSDQAEIGHFSCKDTLRFMSFKREYEVGVILPSWPAVVSYDSVVVLEGMADYNRKDGSDGPHVSHEELPFYHYTHDFCAEIIPDITPDHRFTNLLPYMITTQKDGRRDTVLDQGIDMEWESGLGAGNRLNACTKLNDVGQSAGFFSAGHDRRDVLWHWPTIGDWIHVEGQYIWDRGHPPAHCEIHPARFIAVKRQNPIKMKLADSSLKFATRVDIYANGDGGALVNNWPNTKPFVRMVRMSSKDYQFSFRSNFSKPSPNAELKVEIEKHKGDSYPADEVILIYADGTISVSIPWMSKGIADTAIYARTVYAYWNEGSGVGAKDTIDEYEVDLKQLYLKRLSEKDGMAEIRLFVNAGNDWIFLNDYLSKGKRILTRGLGETMRKHWELKKHLYFLCATT